MSKEPKKTPDQLLDEAVLTNNLLGVMQAVQNGADVIRIGSSRRTGIPIFEAINKVELLDFIVKTIVEQSRITSGGKLDRERTQRNIRRNLLDRTDNTAEARSFMSRIVTSTSLDRLEIVWRNLKGIMRINDIFVNDADLLVYAAATIPANLDYLVSAGGGINVANPRGYHDTPIMKMLRLASSLPVEEVKALLAVYEKHNVHVRAVDNEKRGLPFYVLKKEHAVVNASQNICIDWVLSKGVDFLAEDVRGEIATDLLMKITHKSLEYFHAVFEKLEAYGYNLPLLLKRYDGKDLINEVMSESHYRRTQFCNELHESTLADKLWNTDDTPSPLLLKAFGLGPAAAQQIFEHPDFKKNLPAARALYEKMARKLPRQCQELLHNGMDLSHLRDLKPAEHSAAVTNVLKRRGSAKGESSPGGAR